MGRPREGSASRPAPLGPFPRPPSSRGFKRRPKVVEPARVKSRARGRAAEVGGGFGWLRACGRLARAARRLGLLGRPASPPAELQFGRAANGAREPDKQTQN